MNSFWPQVKATAREVRAWPRDKYASAKRAINNLTDYTAPVLEVEDCLDDPLLDPSTPEEDVEAEVRKLGIDPDEALADGRAFVTALRTAMRAWTCTGTGDRWCQQAAWNCERCGARMELWATWCDNPWKQSGMHCINGCHWTPCTEVGG